MRAVRLFMRNTQHVIAWAMAAGFVAFGVWSVLGARSKDSSNMSPQELGPIDWRRDFDAASEQAKRSGKPMFVLFDEVPGCATCVGYGKQVLSYPLVQEAVETLFVPVAVYNNVGGDDAKLLKQFDEPAYNNPVVRIVSSDRSELAPRVDGDYTLRGTVNALVAALEKSHRAVPGYLRLLAAEANATKSEHAAFAMACFWGGEAFFGGIDGVIATKPGFIGHHEVVDVEFDPSVLAFDHLVKLADDACNHDRVFTRTDEQQRIAAKIIGDRAERSDDLGRADDQPKFDISQTPLKYLPMTRTQSARVNAALHAKQEWQTFLSPRQLDLYRRIEKDPDAGWADATHSSAFSILWREAIAK